MGNTSSAKPRSPQFSSIQRAFQAIPDSYESLGQVQDALRRNGLESSNLVVAIDFTKSNEWAGKRSFHGRCLHQLGPGPNPYEQVISIIARTLATFDDDGLIPAFGFGDASTQDTAVFSLLHNAVPCTGLDALLTRYRELAPHVRLAGPTSFAPAIQQAIKTVIDSGCQYHILVIIADGQVTRSSDLDKGEKSPQEQETIDAIVAASCLPLSIVMVGVGDGPWDMMQEFDDELPQRRFDNFQFVNFTEISARYAHDLEHMEAAFATNALMEIPQQFKEIQRLKLLGSRASSTASFHRPVRCLQPPGASPATTTAPGVPHSYPSGTGGLAPQYQAGLYPPQGSLQSSFGRHPGVAADLSSSQQGNHGYPSAPPQLPPAAAAPLANPMFVCPISQEIMKDPVIAADGYTYERANLSQWLQSHDTSPMTNNPLPHKQLTPNHSLRSSIMEYKAAKGLK